MSPTAPKSTGTMAQFAIRSMPDTKFVLPLAPTRKITVYHGTSMHAWYDIFGLDDKCAQDRERIAESTVRVCDFPSILHLLV